MEVEFGYARSYYQDYVKFMLARKYRDARLGVLLCPTTAFAALLCELGQKRARENSVAEKAPVYAGMMVTPESLALIMKGDKPEPGKMKLAPSKSPPDVETSMAYEGLNSFVVTIRKKNDPKGETMGLVISREGLSSSWKLTALRLPL